jgi:hypothetical protein
MNSQVFKGDSMQGIAECSVSVLLNMVLMIAAEVREVDTDVGGEEEATSTGPGLLSVKREANV